MPQPGTDRSVEQLYKGLKGPRGLEALEVEYSRGLQIVPVVAQLIGKRKCRVLDLGCGYGRIALPLAKLGYDVDGIDIRRDMIDDAKRRAKRAGQSIRYTVGDMRALPFEDRSFDRIVCLWNTFNHLMSRAEQVATIRESFRVLAPGGRAFFETMNGDSTLHQENPDFPIFRSYVAKGALMTVFVHTKADLLSLCKSARVRGARSYCKMFDGRKKLILELRR